MYVCGAVCTFSFQRHCFFCETKNRILQSANYTKKRQNRAALHTATHHKCVSMHVTLIFHKQERKKNINLLIVLLLLLLLPCAGSEHRLAHSHRTINKCMLFYVNKIYSLVSFFKPLPNILYECFHFCHITLMWRSKSNKI